MLSTSNFASVHTYLGPSSSARGRTCTGVGSILEASQAGAAHAIAPAEGPAAGPEVAVGALGPVPAATSDDEFRHAFETTLSSVSGFGAVQKLQSMPGFDHLPSQQALLGGTRPVIIRSRKVTLLGIFAHRAIGGELRR